MTQGQSFTVSFNCLHDFPAEQKVCYNYLYIGKEELLPADQWVCHAFFHIAEEEPLLTMGLLHTDTY